jgi:hypothetical protein
MSYVIVISHEIIVIEVNETSISSAHHLADSFEETDDLLDLFEENEEEKELVENLKINLTKSLLKQGYIYKINFTTEASIKLYSPPEQSI